MKNILFAFLFISHVSFSQDNIFKLASDVWPPFTDVKDNRAVALDIVEEALNRIGYAAEVDILEFKEVLKQIKTEEYHGSAALWKNPSREKTLLFSKPYLKNKLILVGKKGSNVNDLLALKGKTVAIVSNYAYGKKEMPEVKFVSGKSDQANLKMLLADSVDYMLVDALLIEYLLTYQKEETAQYLEIGTQPVMEKDLYFALRKDVKNAAVIMEKFNAAIDEMMTDGTYNLILQLNWIKTDVDGDGLMEYVPQNTKSLSKPEHTYTIMMDSSSQNGGYYIEGQKYDTWEEVPDKFKVDTTQEASPDDFKVDVFTF